MTFVPRGARRRFVSQENSRRLSEGQSCSAHACNRTLGPRTAKGQNEPCHSLRRHGRSTSTSGPAGPVVGTSGSGRVEMWRGGGRSDISVAAPFVWRCLSGSTVAPFPHPAHRTGRADFPHPALGQDSRLRPRHVAAERGQAYEREVPVEVREWISPAPASSDLMLEAQPPA